MVADWQLLVEPKVLFRGVRVLINNCNLAQGEERLTNQHTMYHNLGFLRVQMSFNSKEWFLRYLDALLRLG